MSYMTSSERPSTSWQIVERLTKVSVMMDMGFVIFCVFAIFVSTSGAAHTEALSCVGVFTFQIIIGQINELRRRKDFDTALALWRAITFWFGLSYFYYTTMIFLNQWWVPIMRDSTAAIYIFMRLAPFQKLTGKKGVTIVNSVLTGLFACVMIVPANVEIIFCNSIGIAMIRVLVLLICAIVMELIREQVDEEVGDWSEMCFMVFCLPLFLSFYSYVLICIVLMSILAIMFYNMEYGRLRVTKTITTETEEVHVFNILSESDEEIIETENNEPEDEEPTLQEMAETAQSETFSESEQENTVLDAWDMVEQECAEDDGEV